MKCAVIIDCREVKAKDGSILTRSGERAWVLECQGGWVEATAHACEVRRGRIPIDVKVFDSREAATEFGKRWKGHPWYVVPSGIFEVVPIKPRMVTEQRGWEVNEDE